MKVQGEQVYWAFSFTKVSLVIVGPYSQILGENEVLGIQTQTLQIWD
jgi:hypothetical protein